MNATRTRIGTVAGLRRYPVKSMQGERLPRVAVGPGGVDGDRRFAVIDAETGRVASAKNPRKWAALLDHRAEWRDGVLSVSPPDGPHFRSDRDDLGAALSGLLGRAVVVSGTPAAGAAIEVHWPAVAGLAGAGTEAVEELPAGRYVDLAPVHLITTATLARLAALAPDSRFDERRFRPNVLIETGPGVTGFAENAWVGRTVVLGAARLRVAGPCSRCVMTTLPQAGLPADAGVLRAVVKHNAAAAGVYAAAEGVAEMAVGDAVWLEG